MSFRFSFGETRITRREGEKEGQGEKRKKKKSPPRATVLRSWPGRRREKPQAILVER